MSTPSPTSPSRDAAPSEDRIEARRYIEALRHSAPLIAALVLVVTATVLLISVSLAKTYQATTRIVLEETVSALVPTDASSTERRLATTEELLTTPAVLDQAAGEIAGATGDSIGAQVSSAVDPNANIIDITATSGDPQNAADVANAVAEAFLEQRAMLEEERILAAREDLLAEIDQLENDPNASPQIAAIRDRVSQLSIAGASAGADLQIAQRAQVPSAATSPRPLRNAVLAFFAALFAGVLLALGRDQLMPRVGGARELSRIVDLPVLVGIPYVRQRFGATRKRILTGVEDEAFQTLRASLEFALPPSEQRVILITGALHGEGKTTVAGRLGRALARVGHKTLVVSADLRVPKLHEQFGLSLGVGLSDLLSVMDRRGTGALEPELVERATNMVVAPRGPKAGRLDVITSGSKASDPAALVGGPPMQAFLEHVRGLDYDYVFVDAPPMLGLPDAQVLSRWVDSTILVSRLDRITVEHASELRDLLDRLGANALGLIVIGVTSEISPYYMSRRPSVPTSGFAGDR